MLVRDPWQTQEWRFFGLSRVTYGHGGGTEVGLWIGVGGAVYWVGGSFVPRRAESVAWKEVRSDGASLELILIGPHQVGAGSSWWRCFLPGACPFDSDQCGLCYFLRVLVDHFGREHLRGF